MLGYIIAGAVIGTLISGSTVAVAALAGAVLGFLACGIWASKRIACLEASVAEYGRALKRLLDLCDHAADFSNGVEWQGMDEGREMANRIICNEILPVMEGGRHFDTRA